MTAPLFLVTSAAWFVATSLWFTPDFREWRWLALGAVTIIWGLAATVVVARAPAFAAPK